MDCRVADVRMNHPERHSSMVAAFWSELPRLVRARDEAGATWAMVLSSVGKYFTAGMDLGVFAAAGTLGLLQSGRNGPPRPGRSGPQPQQRSQRHRLENRHRFSRDAVPNCNQGGAQATPVQGARQ